MTKPEATGNRRKKGSHGNLRDNVHAHLLEREGEETAGQSVLQGAASNFPNLVKDETLQIKMLKHKKYKAH